MTAPIKIPKILDPEELIPTRVEVTQEMIDKARIACYRKSRGTNCVMYEALKPYLNFSFTVGFASIYEAWSGIDEDNNEKGFNLPAKVALYILNFDMGKVTKPTTFTIDIPRKYLK